MKYLILILFLLLTSCKKENTQPLIEEDNPIIEKKFTEQVGIDPVKRVPDSIRYEYIDENYVSYYKKTTIDEIENFYIQLAKDLNLTYKYDIISNDNFKSINFSNFSVMITKEKDHIKWTITK